MTRISSMFRFGERPAGQRREADALRATRRLIAAGAAAVALLGGGLVLAAFDSTRRIDVVGIEAETMRAERAVAALTGDGMLSADDVRRLDQDFSLSGARLVASSQVAGPEVAIRIDSTSDADGPLFLAWTPRRFGSEMFARLAPRRMVLSGLLTLIVGCVFFWLSRTTRELDRLRRAARELAIRDALTGLANRRHFDETLRDGFGGTAASLKPFALLCLDLDDFKMVNDTMGHATGDRMLRSIGKRLAALAGPGDFVARLGGDEFAIIRRSGLAPEELAAFARSAILELCRVHPVRGAQISIGVSIGIALAPDHAYSPDELMHQADTALYRAKAQAGPAFVFAEEEADRRADANRDAA